MVEANDIHVSIYQNLIDAGCDTEMNDQCITFVENGGYSDMLPILTQYREDSFRQAGTLLQRKLVIEWRTIL